MSRLCGRPGCSEPGTVAYGMIPEDLLFWVAPLDHAASTETAVLCIRHADSMVVPRGWTLDDRRESTLRLFRPPAPETRRAGTRTRRSAKESASRDDTAQLDLLAVTDETAHEEREWRPNFDIDDDLDGLLEAEGPLLSRAFRGRNRPRR